MGGIFGGQQGGGGMDIFGGLRGPGGLGGLGDLGMPFKGEPLTRPKEVRSENYL